VPLIVCAAIYKLSPLFPSDLESLQELRSPAEILPYESSMFQPQPTTHFHGTSSDFLVLVVGALAEVEIVNPSWDYIPPGLVSLFITNEYKYVCHTSLLLVQGQEGCFLAPSLAQTFPQSGRH
jgi:translation initiation factor eIF-2B subunit beta